MRKETDIFYKLRCLFLYAEVNGMEELSKFIQFVPYQTYLNSI